MLRLYPELHAEQIVADEHVAQLVGHCWHWELAFKKNPVEQLVVNVQTPLALGEYPCAHTH